MPRSTDVALAARGSCGNCSNVSSSSMPATRVGSAAARCRELHAQLQASHGGTVPLFAKAAATAQRLSNLLHEVSRDNGSSSVGNQQQGQRAVAAMLDAVCEVQAGLASTIAALRHQGPLLVACGAAVEELAAIARNTERQLTDTQWQVTDMRRQVAAVDEELAIRRFLAGFRDYVGVFLCIVSRRVGETVEGVGCWDDLHGLLFKEERILELPQGDRRGALALGSVLGGIGFTWEEWGLLREVAAGGGSVGIMMTCAERDASVPELLERLEAVPRGLLHTKPVLSKVLHFVRVEVLRQMQA